MKVREKNQVVERLQVFAIKRCSYKLLNHEAYLDLTPDCILA